MRSRLPFLALPLLLLAGGAAAAAEVKLVAHPSIGGTQIKREVLNAVFLRQTSRWGNGVQIMPVDQSSQSPVRAAFSTGVLSQPVAAVQNYWARQISLGRLTPPPVKPSDAEVLAYVKATPGAIGYVDAGTATDAGVRELQIIE
ncbi:MAG: hypothetical protein AB7O37_09025 [Vicinamibacteria bacterium]